jgi:hypothetical protein
MARPPRMRHHPRAWRRSVASPPSIHHPVFMQVIPIEVAVSLAFRSRLLPPRLELLPPVLMAMQRAQTRIEALVAGEITRAPFGETGRIMWRYRPKRRAPSRTASGRVDHPGSSGHGFKTSLRCRLGSRIAYRPGGQGVATDRALRAIPLAPSPMMHRGAARRSLSGPASAKQRKHHRPISEPDALPTRPPARYHSVVPQFVNSMTRTLGRAEIQFY